MNRIFLLVTAISVAFLGLATGFHAPPSSSAPSGPTVASMDLEPARAVETIREVTAYNVGVPWQTDNVPCIGAMGHNLCELVDQGWKVCAANFVELGTILRIDGFGEYVVLDRVNRRYAHRVDIAMSENEIDKARKFGIRKLAVAVK